MFDVLTKERDTVKAEVAKIKTEKVTAEDLLSKTHTELQATTRMAEQKEQLFE